MNVLLGFLAVVVLGALITLRTMLKENKKFADLVDVDVSEYTQIIDRHSLK